MALLLQLTQRLSQGFGSFWARWPRRVARLEATKAWDQVVKDDPETEEQIHAALDWQVPMFEEREVRHIPHAATWLRGRRWEDEQPQNRNAAREAKRQEGSDYIRKLMAERESGDS